METRDFNVILILLALVVQPSLLLDGNNINLCIGNLLVDDGADFILYYLLDLLLVGHGEIKEATESIKRRDCVVKRVRSGKSEDQEGTASTNSARGFKKRRIGKWLRQSKKLTVY